MSSDDAPFMPADEPAIPFTSEMRASLAHIATPIWFHCAERRCPVVWANAAALKLWKSPDLDELTTRDFGGDTDVSKRFISSHARELRSEEGLTYPWTIYPHGDVVNVRMHLRGARDESGLWGALTEAHEIAAEDRDAATLRRHVANVYLRAPVSMFDSDGTCLAENVASRQIYGALRPLRERAVDPTQIDRLVEQTLASKTLQRAEVRVRTEDGEHWHAVELSLGRDPASGAEALIASEIRVDELHEVQDQLRAKNDALEQALQDLRSAQAHMLMRQQMASLGELVAGIAHELNTPVGALVGTADNCRQALDKLLTASENKRGRLVEVLKRNHEVVLQAGVRIGEVVTALRRFAHLDQAAEQRVQLNDEIAAAVELFRPRLGPHVAIEMDLAPLPEIRCRPQRINQAVLNLLLNAQRAVGDAGCISVRSRRQGDEASIEVQDDGVGIAADRLGRIFEPGYTTWNLGVGVGLGLPICFNVAEEHGGRVEAVSPGEGEGATMTMWLPGFREQA
jgi:signal transduction histidine kinase